MDRISESVLTRAMWLVNIFRCSHCDELLSAYPPMVWTIQSLLDEEEYLICLHEVLFEINGKRITYYQYPIYKFVMHSLSMYSFVRENQKQWSYMYCKQCFEWDEMERKKCPTGKPACPIPSNGTEVEPVWIFDDRYRYRPKQVRQDRSSSVYWYWTDLLVTGRSKICPSTDFASR